MPSVRSVPSASATYFLSLLRIVAGFLFFCHSLQKLLGIWGGHKVPLVALVGLAALIEFVGGALIMVGLFTKVAAFIASGEMAFAYFLVHIKRGPLPIQNGGDAVVLFCFLFLYLVFAGPGALSVDSQMRKRI